MFGNSQMRAVDVRKIAKQLSLGRIAPTTSFVRRRNLISCAATPKRAPLVAMFQITMNESFDRPHPDRASFLTRTGLQRFHGGISLHVAAGMNFTESV
jgi:hypothetical protein